MKPFEWNQIIILHCLVHVHILIVLLQDHK